MELRPKALKTGSQSHPKANENLVPDALESVPKPGQRRQNGGVEAPNSNREDLKEAAVPLLVVHIVNGRTRHRTPMSNVRR